MRIEYEVFEELKDYLGGIAVHRSKEELEKRLSGLRFEAFAPVRSQLCELLRAVNKPRKLASLPLLSKDCLELKRRVYKPFAKAA